MFNASVIVPQRLHVVPEFLVPETCAALIATAEARGFHASQVQHSGSPHPSRTSHTVCLSHQEAHELVTRVEQLLPDVGRARFEPAQVTRYEVGQFYGLHSDVLQGELRQGQRVATVLVYLNDVHEGGETRFPALQFSAKPVTGTALLFFPADDHGREFSDMVHEARPPLSGRKYVAQIWVRQYPDVHI